MFGKLNTETTHLHNYSHVSQYFVKTRLAAITAVSISGLVSKIFPHLENLTFILLKMLQVLSNLLLIIARQTFSSPAIDFQVNLSQNCNSGTFTVFLVSNSSVDFTLCFRLLSC
jgi:hypothetical protein